MKKDSKDHAEGMLATAAKTIGAAVGSVVSLAAHPAPKAAPVKPASPGKLQSKGKTRLPRKQKKALKKAGLAT